MQTAKKPAAPGKAQQLIARLNQSLASAIDLKLQAKQAHWNVKGETFIALHELFDTVATEADGYADMLAERAVQLGGVAQGTLQVVARQSSLDAYPLTMQGSQPHVAALTGALRAMADNARQGIDVADEAGDKVTADLFTEVARGLDKLRWFVESSRK